MERIVLVLLFPVLCPDPALNRKRAGWPKSVTTCTAASCPLRNQLGEFPPEGYATGAQSDAACQHEHACILWSSALLLVWMWILSVPIHQCGPALHLFSLCCHHLHSPSPCELTALQTGTGHPAVFTTSVCRLVLAPSKRRRPVTTLWVTKFQLGHLRNCNPASGSMEAHVDYNRPMYTFHIFLLV